MLNNRVNQITGKWTVGLLAAGMMMASSNCGLADTWVAFVGTYTGARSEGIYAYRFDTTTGRAEPLGLAARTANPTFLAVHPDGKHLYAANEVGQWQGRPGGYVTAFEVDVRQGRLRELNQQSTVGDGPCHLSVDATGKMLMAANYGGGSVVSYSILPDGTVGPNTVFFQHKGASVNPDRQKEPHAHSITPSPDNRFALVADLGADRVMSYPMDVAAGRLRALETAAYAAVPGSGPRHLAFSPDGKVVYVIQELLSTIGVLAYSTEKGSLELLQTISTLPPDFHGPNSTAEVRVHPNGKFVFGSNRGANSIAVFQVGEQGKLTWVESVSTQGKTPRNFNLDPTGNWLWAAHQDSDSIVIFSVNLETGHLTSTGQRLEVGAPVCIRFVRVP